MVSIPSLPGAKTQFPELAHRASLQRQHRAKRGGGGVCAIWPNSLKITQLFVCWYEYKFTACLCVCAHQAATLYSPSFLQPWTPSGHRCWRGPGFEPASLIVGCSARAAVHAATAAPQRASPSLRLVYCKVFLITPPSLHTLLLFVFWLSFRSLVTKIIHSPFHHSSLFFNICATVPLQLIFNFP